MKERELRGWCRRELRALELDPPLRVDVLCERLGERRGRPIRLVPFPLPTPGPFGVWLATVTNDYIVYQAQTTRVHQDHIILHEVGHILADHHSDSCDEEFWRAELPDLSPDLIRRALYRGSYEPEHERQAEMIATIIMEWASAVDYTTPHRDDHAAVRRLEAALNDPTGWLE